jgi:plasmid stabilization system protein ParE
VTQPYILSPGAERDLADIASDTAENWGERQARAYAKKLHGSIQKIALGVRPYKDMGHRIQTCAWCAANIIISCAYHSMTRQR